MKLKNLLMKSVIILFIVFSTVGCGAPNYLTKNLKDIPSDQLSQINFEGSSRKMQIDGINVKFSKFQIVTLLPGAHLIKYEKWVSSEYFKLYIKQLEAEGYTQNSKLYLSYSKTEGGTTHTINPAEEISEADAFVWKEESLNVILEEGKTYRISSLRLLFKPR